MPVWLAYGDKINRFKAVRTPRQNRAGAMLPPFSGSENSNEDLRLIGASPHGRMGGIAGVEAILSNFGFDAG